MFKLDNFGVILFDSFSYKKLLQCSFYENLKNRCKNRFFRKNSKKFVYYNEELVTNSKFQTQLSRKLQRFRTCSKNKKCSIFHDLSEYIIFHMVVTDWTGPLKKMEYFIFKNYQKNLSNGRVMPKNECNTNHRTLCRYRHKHIIDIE